MQGCNYCGVNKFEDMFSLKKLANGGYCSLECVSKDIKQHEYLIKYYNNDIKATGRVINHLPITPCIRTVIRSFFICLTLFQNLKFRLKDAQR